MPYVKQEIRPKLDEVVESLYEDFLFDDELIYILFEYCKQQITPSYNNYKNFIGELRQCAAEIERRKYSAELSLRIHDRSIRQYVCDRKVKLMIDANIQVNGDLNYILYAYCMRHITHEQYSQGWNRRQYSEYCGDLRACAKKIEKEILAPYEDSKIEENGDVL